MLDSPATWLLVVAAIHLGFQLTVDLVVYPALAEVGPERWAAAHGSHSRRITPLVALVYPALVVLVGWTLVAHPDAAGAWVAALGAGVAVAATAFSAAPTHGRLSSSSAEDRPALLRTLARADRVRTAGALVCLVGAVMLVA